MRTAADHFLDLFAYTGWANGLMVGALAGLADGPEKLEAVRLMSHLLRAQDVWLGRIERTEAERLPFWTDDDTLAECIARNQTSTAAWRSFLLDCEDSDFGADVDYQNSKGTSYTSSLRQICTHLVNHGTHHRAQISRILRQTGIAPPATDYIYYCRISDAAR